MAKQIKPGMLCFLTGSIFPENNGRVVTTGKSVQGVDGLRWEIISASPLRQAVLWEDGKVDPLPGYTYESTATPAQLVPIDADPEGTENEEWLVLRKEQAQCKPMHA